jgi:acetylornithine deacetylase/succinyl-diaminopimelate desuccinylase-like protein
MRVWIAGLAALLPYAAAAGETAAERARRYLVDLIRLDTTNPPGNETRAAQYLGRVAEAEGIASELLGSDPQRLNFVARLPGTGARKPLLLIAHTDVVPAEIERWSISPFGGARREGFIYGRGAVDDKSLLAAELAVLVELKRRHQPLARDVILLAEADEEAGSTGIQWLAAHAWKKIDAEFALNEGGFAADIPSGTRMFHVQTAEKVPTRALLRVRGTAGHGSLPRPDNPVVELARALVRLAEAEQPARFNSTTRRYFTELARLPEYAWLAPLLPRLQREQTALAAARQVRERDAELDAQLRTTVVPTVVHAGTKVNVIPSGAEAEVDIRRLPNETREEVIARMRRIVHNTAVEILPAPGQEMPATEPSSVSTALYAEMERRFRESAPRAAVLPYMQRGATDGSFLRQRGMPVYGVPLFLREDRDSRAHGTDERISEGCLTAGTDLLWKIVTGVAAPPGM